MTSVLSSFSLSHLNVLKVESQREREIPEVTPDLLVWRHPKMQREKNWFVLTLSTVRLSQREGRAQRSDAWPFLMWWVLRLSFSWLPDSPVDFISEPGDLHLQSLLLLGSFLLLWLGQVRWTTKFKWPLPLYPSSSLRC